MNKVRKELLRLAEEISDKCDWNDVIFALHVKKIMEPGYKTKNDAMILPSRESMTELMEEVERREKELRNGTAKTIPWEEVKKAIKNRPRPKLKKLPGFPKLSPKEAALQALKGLADHADWDQIEYHLELRRKVEEALQDIRVGREYDHDEVFKEYET
ncbi:MAG: addiction module protein [Gemmataceae bacterium]